MSQNESEHTSALPDRTRPTTCSGWSRTTSRRSRRRGAPGAAPDGEGARDRAGRRLAARRRRLPRADRARARRGRARAAHAHAAAGEVRDRARRSTSRCSSSAATASRRTSTARARCSTPGSSRRSTPTSSSGGGSRRRARAGATRSTSAILPAEAGLDATHVDFAKGCYPGQEPVARLHYRGHPNRGLRVLELDELPDYDAELVHDGKAVGRVTSAARRARRLGRRARVRPHRGAGGRARSRSRLEPADWWAVRRGAEPEAVDVPLPALRLSAARDEPARADRAGGRHEPHAVTRTPSASPPRATSGARRTASRVSSRGCWAAAESAATLSPPRARSSGDRALPCGGRGRTFESCRAHGELCWVEPTLARLPLTAYFSGVDRPLRAIAVCARTGIPSSSETTARAASRRQAERCSSLLRAQRPGTQKGTTLKKGIVVIAAVFGVLAITSGAFAAKHHYLITSSSQIKKGAVSRSDLSKRRPQGAAGQDGETGAIGPQGVAGAQGPKGATGAGRALRVPRDANGVSGYEVRTWRYSKDDANSDSGPGYVGVGCGAIRHGRLLGRQSRARRRLLVHVGARRRVQLAGPLGRQRRHRLLPWSHDWDINPARSSRTTTPAGSCRSTTR